MANQNLPGGRAYYTGKNAYASQAFELDTRRELQTLQNQITTLQNALAEFQTLLPTLPGLSVYGNPATTSGVVAAITGTDGQILRVSGTTLGFGNALTNFVQGTATNDNATAGNIGQYVESVVAAGSVGSWGNDTPKNITSISLTAGDWDVEAFGSFSGSTTGTATQFSISTTTGTTDSANIAQIPSVPTSSSEVYLACSSRRISIGSTTSVFLVGRIKFSGGTPTAGGTLRARRVR